MKYLFLYLISCSKMILPMDSHLGNCDVDVLNILSRFSLSEGRTTLTFSPKLLYTVF